MGISFSSHLYQAGTPWADRSSELATSLNEIFHVKVCVYACAVRVYVSVGVSMVVVGDVFQSLLSVSHCSGKLFAILHD